MPTVFRQAFPGYRGRKFVVEVTDSVTLQANYRFHEAHERTGITQAEFEEAKGTLIGKGLLNRRGAMTTKGHPVANRRPGD